MKVEQIYTGCLAQGAYYIHSKGQGVIIDPLREVNPYIKRAAADGVKIKYILETHFHADFVSGHLTLAAKTGAQIVYGPNANTMFDAHIAKDGEMLEVGDVTIKILHTPGHTLESTTYLLIDENGKDHAIFTGDTLFLGDVGRPDLAQKAATLTQEELAGKLFDSLRTKIMPLADDVTVYPGHGAGSACGKNMMKETVDTLGNQKAMNYALRKDMTREEFIAEVTDGLLPPPAYFPLNVKLNKNGYEPIDEVLNRGLEALSPDAFEALAEETAALVLDVRSPEEFATAHIPGSIFIGIDGNFAPWVGELIVDVNTKIILVAPAGREEEVVTRLARVGFDKTNGYLKGGVRSWAEAGKSVDTVISVPASEMANNYQSFAERIFDVRKHGEYLSEHILTAHHTPLSNLNDHLVEFPQDGEFYLHCAGGYRSMIAASILKSRGIHNAIDVQGGYDAIKETDIPKSDNICPSAL
ncbi:MAG TPA: MBL fold metallo-hydrolase [Flavobacteriales bacterium]|nr:MBL fold metallo-hydrolase [Flavobacteriales bacterium]|tara:strand:+ start:1161 stop:2570 length:1410 start_codon:yes stop_codon:yes gene_type:complete